ncbi:MAG: phosphatase PAP2 family protein [Gemmatimonadota bacterium]
MSASPFIVPRRHRLGPPLLLALLLLALLAVVTSLVGAGRTQDWDRSILLAVLPFRTDYRTIFFQLMSAFGLGECGIPAGILVLLILRHARHFRQAKFYAWVTLSGWALNLLLKQLIGRPRPEVIPHLGRAGWYSFPSGHAMLAPLVYGVGAVLLAALLVHRGGRIALRVGAVLLILSIACARIYLGVHYPSDVLAGLLAGTGWALLWWGLAPPNHRLDPAEGATASELR